MTTEATIWEQAYIGSVDGSLQTEYSYYLASIIPHTKPELSLGGILKVNNETPRLVIPAGSPMADFTDKVLLELRRQLTSREVKNLNWGIKVTLGRENLKKIMRPLTDQDLTPFDDLLLVGKSGQMEGFIREVRWSQGPNDKLAYIESSLNEMPPFGPIVVSNLTTLHQKIAEYVDFINRRNQSLTVRPMDFDSWKAQAIEAVDRAWRHY